MNPVPRSFVRIAFCLILSLTMSAGGAYAEAVDEVEVATTRYVLDNGLVVVHRQDRTAPLVTVQVWFRAGSNTEGEFLGAGISHYVEHMLFKGTPTRDVGQYANEIQSFGGTLNAYTSNDRTVYFFTIDSSYFEQGLEAIADVVQNATFPEEEVIKEQEVIRREIAMYEDNPRSQLWQTMMRTAFRHHNFRYPVIGYRNLFDTISRDDLLEYYRRWYVPNNAILVVTGDVSEQQLRTAVDREFSSWERGIVEPVVQPEEPSQISPRRVSRSFDVQKARVMVGWRGVSTFEPDSHAMDVLGIVAGHGRTSRLHRRLREQEGLVFSISASSWSPEDPGLFIVSAELELEDVDRVLEVLDEEIERLRNEPILEEELERARAKVVAFAVRARETVEGQANALGRGEFVHGDPDYSDRAVEAIRAVTAEDVQAAARRFLVPGTKNVVVMEPLDSKQEDDEEMAAQDEVEDSSPADAVSSFRLANGLRVLVMERPRLPLVTVAATFLGGTRFESEFPAGTAQALAEGLTKGTTTRSTEEVVAFLENVGGSFETVATDDIWGIRTVVLDEHLPMAVDLVADVLLRSTFPDDEVARIRRIQKAAIATERDQPMGAAQLDFRRLRYGDHPWGRSSRGTIESVSEITPEILRRYLAATGSSERGILSVVGNVNAEEVRELLAAQFSELPTGPGTATAPAVPPVRGVVEGRSDMPGRQQAVIIMGFPGCAPDSPDKPALEVLHRVLGGMGNRLFRNLRDAKSLAYSVGCYIQTGMDVRSQIFYIATDPDRVDEALEGLLHEARTVTEELVTEEEIQRAQAAIVGQSAISLQDNRSLAAVMAYNELAGLGYRYHFDKPEAIRAVTREQVLDVAERYFTFNNRVVAVVGPPVDDGDEAVESEDVD